MVKRMVNPHSRARSVGPTRARTDATLSSTTTTTLTTMAISSTRSNSRPWGVSASKMISCSRARRASLDPAVLVHREIGDDVPGVPDLFGLDQQQLHLFLRHRPVLHALGDHHQLTRAEDHLAISKLDGQRSLNYQKQLVLTLVAVPHELALHLGQLHVTVVQIGYDLGAPPIAEPGELLGQTDLANHE